MKKIDHFLNSYSGYAGTILRIGVGFVFIWFGYQGLNDTAFWVGLVPEWAKTIASPETLVKVHGIIELVFGFLLVFGVRVRLAASILFLSLAHTLFLVKGPTLIRDIGLAAALVSIILRPR